MMTTKTTKSKTTKYGGAKKVASIRRSKFEDGIAENLKSRGINFKYEPYKIDYVIPARKAKYLLDWEVQRRKKNGEPLIIESKGYFKPSDRTKHLHIRQSNPDLDIRFVFQRAHTKLHKKSPTTYAMWCDKHGFQWADKGIIPDEWLDE